MRDRIQDARRGDLPAQPRALAAVSCRLDAGATTAQARVDVRVRRAGYAGVEAIAELHMARYEVRPDTRLESATDDHIALSDGDSFDADTLVWTAGVKANPMLRQTDLPLDLKGRLPRNADLTVHDVADVFAAGDCAAVPDLTRIAADPRALRTERPERGTAGQTACRQPRCDRARRPRKELQARARGIGRVPRPLPRHRRDLRLKLRGIPAWLLHRAYHVTRMPTLNRKIRVLTDWTAALSSGAKCVSLGQLQQPHTEFEVARSTRIPLRKPPSVTQSVTGR